MFLGSTGLQFAISVIGVLVFTGLTAYDTQRIKATTCSTPTPTAPTWRPSAASTTR